MNRKFPRGIWLFSKHELLNYFGFMFGQASLQALNVFLTLRFIAVQKNVQNGEVISNWKNFLFLGIAVAIVSAVIQIFKKLYELKISMYLRFNLFRRYRKMFQTYEKPIKLKCDFLLNIISSIDNIIILVFNAFLAIKTTEMIAFNTKITICALILLLLSILLGICRGIKRATISDENNAITQKEGNLVKFQTFSKTFLENALTVLRIETNARTRDEIKSTILSLLPTIFKAILVVVCINGFVNTLAEGEVYSNYYIVLTAFGTILTISSQISSILENIFACIKISKNEEIKELNAFEKKEKTVKEKAKKEIVNKNLTSATIFTNFTADIATHSGIKFYKLLNDLHIKIGQNIMLVGKKGTGKTRLLQLLESLYEDRIMIYNDRTTVFQKFFDNFKSNIGWNYEQIQQLAKGLKLYRLLIPEEELKRLDLKNLNTGDMHLMAALVMLYYAINIPDYARIIILDELLANIDQENAQEILEFVVKTCEEINATIIFVGHSQQEMIKPYCSSLWTITDSENAILVEETLL